MLSGITTGNEYMSTPITPMMDKPSNKKLPTHKKVKGRTPSATSTSSNGRLYSYVSGSDGDEEENDTSSSSNRKRRHWRKGSPHSTVSSSNEMDTFRMRNDQVSHLSLSEDSDTENATSLQYSQTGKRMTFACCDLFGDFSVVLMDTYPLDLLKNLLEKTCTVLTYNEYVFICDATFLYKTNVIIGRKEETLRQT